MSAGMTNGPLPARSMADSTRKGPTGDAAVLRESYLFILLPTGQSPLAFKADVNDPSI